MARRKIISVSLLATVLLATVFAVHLYNGKKASPAPALPGARTDIQQRELQKRNPDDIDAFYNDNGGTSPVDRDFDNPSGALCGNGASLYHTSTPPRKAVPAGWTPPPPVGVDPSYVGPDPLAPFKESPFAMPAARQVLRRPIINNKPDRRFSAEVKKVLERPAVTVRYISESTPALWLQKDLPGLTMVEENSYLNGNPAASYSRLRADGITHVVVDRSSPRPAPWIEDTYAETAIRLRDHLPTNFFQALAIGRNYILYAVQKTTHISAKEQAQITRYIRKRLAGRPARFPDIEGPVRAVDQGTVRTIISLRGRSYLDLKGRKIARRMGSAATLQAALDESIKRLRAGWKKSKQSVRSLYGVSLPDTIPAAMDRLEVDVDVFTEMPRLTDRSARRLYLNAEIGVDGQYITTDGHFYYLEPSYALQRMRKTPYRFLLRLLQRSQLNRLYEKRNNGRLAVTSDWFYDSDLTYGLFRTLNWVETTPGGSVSFLYRGFLFVSMDDVSHESIANAVREGAEWLVRHQSSDGQFGYRYEPFNRPGQRWYPGGNIVRHGLNPYTLLLAHSAAPNPAYVEAAKRGIDFALRFLRREGSRCVICHRDVPAKYYNAKIGAAAVTILSILKLAEFDNIEKYRPALACLAEEILYMQDPNGHFRQYDVPENHPYYGAESTIPPGQLLMVLARLYEHTQDSRFLTAAKKALPFYLRAWRHLVQKATHDSVYVDEDRANIVGIIPWLIMALRDLYFIEPHSEYVDAAFELQNWISTHLFYSAERSRFPDYLGAAFKVHTEVPAINACQFTEGATALHDLARRVRRQVTETREAALLGARFCMQLQFGDQTTTFFVPEPGVALGGFRYHLGATRLRNDYSYHALAALAQALQYIPPGEFSAHPTIPAFLSVPE